MTTPADGAETILKARARALAQPVRRQSSVTSHDHVVFRLATALFAIPMTDVLEVFTPRQVTPLPGWPRGNAGLTAWRGDLLLVLDVRAFLAVTAAPNTLVDRTIVLRPNHITAGIIVDEIIGIEPISDAAREAIPDRLVGIGSGAIAGITSKGVIILDSAALLSHHARGG